MSIKTDIANTVVPTTTRSQRLLTVAAAVVAAVGGWVLIEGIGGVDLRAPAFDGSTASQDVGLGAVVFASLVAGVAAWGLLALLERSIRRPRRTWTVFAVAGLIVSLGGPMSGTGIDPTHRGLLVVLHVIVAAVLIPLLYRTAATDRNARS